MPSQNQSPFSGLYKQPFQERQKILAEWANLTSEEVDLLKNYGYFTESQLDQLIENTIGVYFFERRLIKRCVFAFLLEASSTR